MEKAQVFLTEDQKSALRALSAKTGRKQSEIIRHGVDLAIAEAKRQKADWKASLTKSRGMWQDRPDVEETLSENRRRWRERQGGDFLK